MSPTPLSSSPRILIGTAGWATPKADRDTFGTGASVLARYATRLHLAEINSSFYRPHQRKTYERWAATVPDDFRFSVKAPREITHELGLRRPARPLKAFVEQCAGLGHKLGAVLVQLPPSLPFEARIAAAFFRQLHVLVPHARIVCEPRHPSWLEPAAMRLFDRNAVSRVIADPNSFGEPMLAAGSGHPGYWRLHGSPHIYRSAYTLDFLRRLGGQLRDECQRGDVFVVFDNTAQGYATSNALELVAIVRGGGRG